MHPSISDAAVIGVRLRGREYDDELPRAYVVTGGKDSVSLGELEVMQYVKNHLASFKALDGGVEFVDSIPRNHNGKIMRQLLMKRAVLEVVGSHATDAKI